MVEVSPVPGGGHVAAVDCQYDGPQQVLGGLQEGRSAVQGRHRHLPASEGHLGLDLQLSKAQ